MGKGFLRLVYWLGRAMEVIAGFALVFMMTLTTCDVILRSFGKPIIGTYEMVAFTGGVVIGFSTPITSWMRGHIFVDFLYQKLPRLGANLVNIATRLLGIVLFLVVGYNLMGLAKDMYNSGEVSLTLQLPFYPIAFGIGFALFVQVLVLVCDLVKIARNEYE